MAEIEYFYAAHSAFAYLGSARFMEIAAAAGRRIRHKPIDLRHVVAVAGSIPFNQRSQAHYDYYFGREIERWSQYRNAPVLGRTPTHHRNDITLPNCTLIAGELQGLNIDRLAHAMLERHWRDDADLADADTLKDIAASVDIDAAPLLAAVETEAVQSVYRGNTEEAVRRSVFGSPTYFVDGDMFYGQDRLELIERALKTPFAGAWPPAGTAA